MKINDMKEKTCVSMALKMKRMMRVIRRPFIRVKSDCSVDLYADETVGDPIMSTQKKLDSDLKLFDIACIIAAFCAFCSFIKAICRIFN